jgi:hypothetical protein
MMSSRVLARLAENGTKVSIAIQTTTLAIRHMVVPPVNAWIIQAWRNCVTRLKLRR